MDNTIRTKTGESGPINPQDFSQKIQDIPTGSAKTELEITTNLMMERGDQTIAPEDSATQTMSKVIVKKPETLISSNIRSGVEIGGVVGDFTGEGLTEKSKTEPLNMSEGNQIINPDAGTTMSQVTIIKPDTFIPENIKKDVNIGGIIGTLEMGGIDTSDATATSRDILQGKTAYAKGVKLTGSVLTYDGAFVGNTHTITATLTNVTAASGNATTIAVGERKVLTYTAADGYTLPEPDSVTVTGATGVWNKDAGTLTLSNPTGNVTFTIAGVEVASGIAITVNYQNGGGTNGIIYDGQNSSAKSISLNLGANEINIQSGYAYVEGDDPNGRINIGYFNSKPTVSGGVTITNWDASANNGGGAALFKVDGVGTININFICLIEGTQITLADGSTKAIEDITYDDELLVWNFYDGKFDKAKPSWIKVAEVAPRYNLVKFSNGSEVGFVGAGGEKGYHRIFNKEAGAFTYTGNFKETPNGTTTFAQDGTFPTVISQEVVEKEVKFYNVITDKHYNIFANGILTSCRLSNEYKIEDMKYVGERLITDKQIEDYFDKIQNKKQ